MPRELVSATVLNSADAWRCARRTTQRTNLCFYPVTADEMAPLSYLLIIVLRLNNVQTDRQIVLIPLNSLNMRQKIHAIVFYSLLFCKNLLFSKIP